MASLQANDLPNPVVEVCVLGNPAYHAVEVAAARTLQVGPPTAILHIHAMALCLWRLPLRDTSLSHTVSWCVLQAANFQGETRTWALVIPSKKIRARRG